MDKLPTELIFHIISFLEAHDIIPLRLVSQRLHNLARDAQLWRGLCFEASGSERLRRRKQRQQGFGERVEAALRETGGVGVVTTPERGGGAVADAPAVAEGRNGNRRNPRLRGRVDWDPTYPGEKVDWYQEYVHRHGPISMSWLQQPACDALGGRREARGLGLFRSREERGNEGIVVAPLDDGSVCLWDIRKSWRGGKSTRGKMIARSKANLLSVNGMLHSTKTEQDNRSTMTSTGVVECVSVNNSLKRAYFAVQSGLNEVDLQTLQVISHTRFPFSISALSESEAQVPLTVGTTLSLHFHDARVGHSSTVYGSGKEDRCDVVATFPRTSGKPSAFQSLFDTTESDLATYAPLFQPGPLSILHSHRRGSSWDGRGDIYVAGRFPSILRYDRRMWPKLRGTIHSGARLCSITSLPYDFVLPEEDMSMESVRAGHPKSGTTLVACGEYNGKGSLEFYGVPPDRCSSTSTTPVLERPKYPSYRNRQTASASKLLSVATHGTRIAFSDGDGNIKWMERGGNIEVRRWNINEQGAQRQDPYLFTRSRFSEGPGEVARKILPTNDSGGGNCFNQDDLLVWTGERIGLVTFTKKPQFSYEVFEEIKETAEEIAKRRDERQYSQVMRLALSMQADEVRFMRGLGVMGLE